MLQLILSGIGFSIWALYVIITYYSTNYSPINHIETTSDYSGYLISLLVIYSGYKIYTIFFSEKRIVRYNFWHILGFSILHLLIICIAYTSIAQAQVSGLFGGVKPSSMMLFFHCISLLLYPVVLVIIIRSFGSTVLGKLIEGWNDETLRLRFPVETTFGFFAFSTILLILGALGVYNLTGLLVVLIIAIAVSYPGLKKTYQEIQSTSISFENHNPTGGTTALIAPKLLSSEIAFIIVSFLISVSLINALRPMPIGWDDLGVYMNYPKIIALTGQYILGTGMYAWQLITGTGFLFSYVAAQAFYVNQLGGILAVITITAALSLIFEEKNRKYLLSLPLILATVFYAMPMNIFQQAKDMKLDPALLFISISAFLLLFHAWKDGYSHRKSLSFIALAGIIVGFAFSVKFTTLMLILAGLGFLAYRKLSLAGFFTFFFTFIAVFTWTGLWKQMNVWMPSDKPEQIQYFVIICGLIALISGFLAYKQYKKDIFIEWITGSIIFILSIAVGLSPWLIKNTLEVQPWAITSGNASISTILNGSGGTFVADFSKLYSTEEFQARQEAEKNASITSDGKSQNEDFGRYFGYEKGLNNYLKLPANLTFQKNQPGEFTDITYIFLAFIPAILLFVRGRRGLFPGVIGVLLAIMYLYYFRSDSGLVISTFLGNIELPLGYLMLLIFNILFLLFIHFGIEKNERSTRLKEIAMTLGVYGFLFGISAFGIVWYGILVYFLFLALIGLAAMSFVSYDDTEEKDDDLMSVKITLTAIFAIFIMTYFIRSSFPHGWNNLKEASYNEFKYNVLNQEESIFVYRQDYVTPIATLNINNVPKLIEDIKNQATTKELKTLFASDKLKGIEIRDFAYVLFSLSSTKNQAVAHDADRLGNMLYKAILYPNDTYRNDGGIYRIGTFMTYLIDRNRQRFFEDSLVFSFETYFHDESPEKTIDRMKKLGLKYLLVDLNAATIDKDPRHALTNRFENLLHTMKARNLKLVDTDNTCLRFAIDKYKNGELQDPNTFIDVAGTNYESYRTLSGSEVTIARSQKQGNCYNQILRTIYGGGTLEKYPYLVPLKDAIDAEKAYGTDAASQEKLRTIFARSFGQSWFALFEIYDAPKLAEPINPPPTETGSGTIILSGNTAAPMQ